MPKRGTNRGVKTVTSRRSRGLQQRKRKPIFSSGVRLNPGRVTDSRAKPAPNLNVNNPKSGSTRVANPHTIVSAAINRGLVGGPNTPRKTGRKTEVRARPIGQTKAQRLRTFRPVMRRRGISNVGRRI